MEALRKPEGIGAKQEISNLDLQIVLGEMDRSQGKLTTEQKIVLARLIEVAPLIGASGQELSTNEIIEASIQRPVLSTPTGYELMHSL